MTNADTLEAIASGTIAPDARRYVTLTLTDGSVTEADVLTALHGAGLVSADVRAVYLEVANENGAVIITALDADNDATVAWLTLPTGAGV